MVRRLLKDPSWVDAELAEALQLYNLRVLPDQLIRVVDREHKQELLSGAIDERVASELAARGGAEMKAKLKQLEQPYANAWLRCAPNEHIGMKMTNEEVKAAVAFVLSVPLSDRQLECPFCPGEILDPHHNHAVTCKRGNHRIQRHDQLRDEIAEAMRMTGMTVATEVKLPFTDLRPGDVFVTRFAGGRDRMLDVAVKSPLQAAYLARSANNASAMFTDAEAKKRQRNEVEQKCRAQQKDFQPLIASTYGAWAPAARSVFGFVAAKAVERRPVPGGRPQVLEKIYRRLGFILMRANARAILDRLPISCFIGARRRFDLP